MNCLVVGPRGVDAFPCLGFLEPLRCWALPPRGSGPRWVNGAVRASGRRKGRDESDKHVLGEDTSNTVVGTGDGRTNRGSSGRRGCRAFQSRGEPPGIREGWSPRGAVGGAEEQMRLCRRTSAGSGVGRGSEPVPKFKLSSSGWDFTLGSHVIPCTFQRDKCGGNGQTPEAPARRVFASRDTPWS